MPERTGQAEGNPLPFEDLFAPLVQRAREKLRGQIDPALHDLLAPEAHSGWEKYLLARLVSAGTKAALWQFQIFKTVRAAFPQRDDALRVGNDHLYRAFVGHKPAERLQRLCAEFPALAGLCNRLEENWVSTVSEFLVRLEGDRDELRSRFHIGDFSLSVTALEAGLSDPHNGGRCVVRLGFKDGSRLVYKPRCLAPEIHFAALVEKINGCIPHQLRAAHGWDRGDYGWMENISPHPCDAPADVHAFYWRAGVLLGLVYIAGGVDVHRENLIAAGEYPVLIDLEALGHSNGSYAVCETVAARSVLRTGFLPYLKVQSGIDYNWSALSRTIHAERSATQWAHINQDNMAQSNMRQKFRDHTHLPTHAGEPKLAGEYLSDIKAGFRWVGANVLENQANNREIRKWMNRLLALPRRLIVGSTVGYQAMLEERTSCQSMRDNQVHRDHSAESQDGTVRHAHEIKALDQLDVPYFSSPDWEGKHPPVGIFQLPSKQEYLAQMVVITNSLEGIPQSWQEPTRHEEITK